MNCCQEEEHIEEGRPIYLIDLCQFHNYNWIKVNFHKLQSCNNKAIFHHSKHNCEPPCWKKLTVQITFEVTATNERIGHGSKNVGMLHPPLRTCMYLEMSVIIFTFILRSILTNRCETQTLTCGEGKFKQQRWVIVSNPFDQKLHSKHVQSDVTALNWTKAM